MVITTRMKAMAMIEEFIFKALIAGVIVALVAGFMGGFCSLVMRAELAARGVVIVADG